MRVLRPPHEGGKFDLSSYSTTTKLDLQKIICDVLAPIKKEIWNLKEKVDDILQEKPLQKENGLVMEAEDLKEPDSCIDNVIASLNKGDPEVREEESKERKATGRMLLPKLKEKMFQKRRGPMRSNGAQQLKEDLRLDVTAREPEEEGNDNRKDFKNLLLTLGAVKKRENELNFESWNWKRRMKD